MNINMAKISKVIVYITVFILVPPLTIFIATQLAASSHWFVNSADGVRSNLDWIVGLRLIFSIVMFWKWKPIINAYLVMRNVPINRVQRFQLDQMRIVFGATAVAFEVLSLILRVV